MARGGARPGAGRPRKSPALKLVTGTYRPERDVKASDDADAGPMVPPLYLSNGEQSFFARIAEILTRQKRSSPDHAEHVGLLALRLAQIARFQAVLETAGDTFTSRTTKKVDGETVIFEMVRARPEVTMLSDALRHAQSLLGELMLNPSAALKIASATKSETGDFDDF